MNSDLPVLLMNSAKSPIESLSTRASRGWGALDLSLAPELEVGRGIGLNAFADLPDFGESRIGFACSPASLLIEDE